METLTKFLSPYFTTSIPRFIKLNDYLINPLISGFLAFSAFLIIISFMHFLAFLIGSSGKFEFDFLDFLLAGFAFFLQMMSTLFKSLVK